MPFRVLSPQIKPTYIHVFIGKSGAQLVADYDDYDEALLQLDEGIADDLDATYRYSLELPADVSTGIKRFDAQDRLPAWRGDRLVEQQDQLGLARWYQGAR